MKKKFTILSISVFLILFFDISYVFFYGAVNLQQKLGLNNFEKELLDRLITNIILYTISFISLKLSFENFKITSIFSLDRKLIILIPVSIVVGIITNIAASYVVDIYTRNLIDFGHGEKIGLIISDVKTFQNKLVYIITVGIIVPVVEEMYFRLYVYRVLRGKFNIIVAILINIIIFLIFHINLELLPFFIIANIVICLCYEYTKNILMPIVIHMTLNIY